MEKLLNDASRNLFNRSPDEHFESMDAIMAHAEDARHRSFETEVDLNDRRRLFWSADANGDPVLSLPDNRVVYPNNFAFQQFATIAGIPVRTFDKMRERDGIDLVLRNLNALAYTDDEEREQKLFIEQGSDGKLNLRSHNGLNYTRIYDATVLRKIHEMLLPGGMSPALPTMNTNANRDNIFGNNKPALFRGESDSFCFFMEDKDPDDDLGGMRVGLMFKNSEVGTSSFTWTTLYFRDMCANYLIWGATGIRSKRIIHRGNIAPKWHEFQADIATMYEELLKRKGEHLTIFAKAKHTPFAGDGSPTEANKGVALEKLVGPKRLKISKKRAETIIDAALMPINGGDLSYWSVANGITFVAKDTTNVATMVDASRAAQTILAGVK